MARFNRLIILLAAAFISALSTQAADMQTYRNKIGLFNQVKVLDNIRVVIKCNPDSAGYAVFSTTKQFASAPMFSINKGVLKVQVSTNYVNNPNLPTIYLYTDYITAIDNSSVNTVSLADTGAVPSFKARLMGNGSIIIDNLNATDVSASIVSGNGTISLAGKAKKCLYRMIGTGVIQADQLVCDEADCKILGSGSIGCDAKYKLDVRGVGSTKVYYRGNPEIKKVGGGKLIPLLDSAPAEYTRDSDYQPAASQPDNSDEISDDETEY